MLPAVQLSDFIPMLEDQLTREPLGNPGGLFIRPFDTATSNASPFDSAFERNHPSIFSKTPKPLQEQPRVTTGLRANAAERLAVPLSNEPGFWQRLNPFVKQAETAAAPAIESAATKVARTPTRASYRLPSTPKNTLGKMGAALVGVPLVVGGVLAAISWLDNRARAESWANRIRNEPIEPLSR